MSSEGTKRTRGGKAADVLSKRALNRATLERQLLLRRTEKSALGAIRHLVSLQAQVPNAPYIGLWTRLAQFEPAELVSLIEGRKVARTVLMRSTLHLVDAGDCLALRPVVQPALDKDIFRNTIYGPGARGIEVAELVSAASEVLAGEALTAQELGPLLAERFPGRDAKSLAYAVRNLVPLVQVPPRGIWGESGKPRWSLAGEWLGSEPTESHSLEQVLRRYLGAFGPASVQDVQTWSGLTGLRNTFEQMRRELRVYRDENGRELFDLPDVPLPDPDTPAPARFIADFDNLFVSHADRSRLMNEEQRKRLSARNGMMRGVLLDGEVNGTWRLELKASAAKLQVTPFRRLGGAERDELEAEGMRLLQFAYSGDGTASVEFESSD